jgi:GMP synthase (glutamine-hydrolysing)
LSLSNLKAIIKYNLNYTGEFIFYQLKGNMKHIAILDFGSQYTHLIARTIRELGVLAKIYNNDVSIEDLKGKASGIILSGGPQSVFGKESLRIEKGVLEMRVPVLGICYGHQLLAHILGGVVKTGNVGEYGKAELGIVGRSKIFEGISSGSQVWMSHGDSVTKVPQDFEAIGETTDCEITAMANNKRKIFGLQFHPEVAHSEKGVKMIENFVLDICDSKKDWKIENIADELIEKIKKQVGERKVFILVSGGVDSNVAFALLTKALGEDRVKGLYINTGFMRQDESKRIMKRFKHMGFSNLEIMDAGGMFFEKLVDVYEPEEKRTIIGRAFLDAKDLAAEKMGLDVDQWLLGQGTIYPDTIESGGTKNSNKIKTHHNRVDAITKMLEKGLIIEPIVDLYKDEVRKIGRLLNLPKELVDRHPFPGPGLAIRCLCWDVGKRDEVDIAQIDKKIEEFCIEKKFDIFSKILPIKSVGVQGDNRTYAHPLVVFGENDWDRLSEISSAITNANKEVNRVVLLLNKKEKENPIFYLSKKSIFLSKGRIELLRKIDRIVSDIIRDRNIYADIDQFPVVLVPICDKHGRESIVLRPINTRDFMTLQFYKMQKDVLIEIVKEIDKVEEISYIFFDVTNKPPGTTEWE